MKFAEFCESKNVEYFQNLLKNIETYDGGEKK